MTRKYSITNILANTVSMFTQLMICFRYKIESAHKSNSYAHPQHDRVCINWAGTWEKVHICINEHCTSDLYYKYLHNLTEASNKACICYNENNVEID